MAMCLRAEDGAVIADKTAPKVMHETGMGCGIRRETDCHRRSPYKDSGGETFENCWGATSWRTARGRNWGRMRPSSSRSGARLALRPPTTSGARRRPSGRSPGTRTRRSRRRRSTCWSRRCSRALIRSCSRTWGGSTSTMAGLISILPQHLRRSAAMRAAEPRRQRRFISW